MSARYLIILFLLFVAADGISQQSDLLMGRGHSAMLEREIQRKSMSIHLGAKPYQVKLFQDTVSYSFLTDSTKYYSKEMALLMRDHLLKKKTKDYFIALDPLMDFQYGNDFALPKDVEHNKRNLLNMRGLVLQGDIGKRFSFNSGFYEVQILAPRYIDYGVDTSGIMPGWGRTKYYKTHGYDYSMSFGNLSLAILKNWNVQIGYGKHFIGHGYRSLFLTDGVFNAPYIKSSATFFEGKLFYTTTYSTLQSLERLPLGDTPESLFKRKGASFHYLSYKPNATIEIGLFEGTIWQRVDSIRTYHSPWNTMVPIIGVNTAIEGLNGSNNVYGGLNVRINLPYSISVYGQYLIDDLDNDRAGYQVGLHVFDCVIPRLNIRAEYNHVGDFVYAGATALESITHFNQPLGHPSGGATDELIIMADYKWKRLFGRVKYNQIEKGIGPEGQWNTTYSDLSTSSDQSRFVGHFNAESGIKLNLKTDLEVYLGYTQRHSGEFTNFVYFGIRTNLHNSYFDF